MAKGGYTILSLDLGSTLGWCLVKEGIIVDSGTVPLNKKETHPGQRYLSFSNWLAGQWRDNKPINEIFYEDVPRFESAAAARVFCGLLSILQVFCLVHRTRCTCMMAGTVKKDFAGHGHAKKPEICKVAHKMGWKHGYPDTDIDHDEADAIAVAHTILRRRDVDLKFLQANI